MTKPGEGREYNKEYYKKNKTGHSHAMKKNYEEKRDEYLERAKEQRERDPEKVKAYNKEYYKKHRRELLIRRRERYAEEKRKRESNLK